MTVPLLGLPSRCTLFYHRSDTRPSNCYCFDMWVRTVHCVVVLFRTVACIRLPWIVWVQGPPVGSRLLSRKRWIFGSCLGWPQWEVDWDKGLEIWSLVSILGMSLDLNMWVFRALQKKIGPKKWSRSVH